MAWMPSGRATFVNPHPRALQIVGAIEGVEGQKLDPQVYLALLADRVQKMYDQAPPEERKMQTSVLSEAGLLDDRPTTETAALMLVLDNSLLQDRLRLMGLPGKLPPSLTHDDPAARKLIEETTLEQWVDVLTMMPAEPDRS
ncbi:MAG TPA: hypothetical protein VE713_04975 [Pyrinomonadaceae bacterium]|nr:hypothetical protein [Pyrinomonadaceae bacterium]